MKKILSLLLAFVMLLSLCACGGNSETPTDTGSAATTTNPTENTEPQMDNGFLVGFGYGDITPTESVPLQGYGNHASRMSTDALSKLYALSVVVCDGDGNTAVVISADSASLGTSLCDDIRANIEKETGIPATNILITCIHQHSTPDPACKGVDSSARYREMAIQNTTQGVKDALEDLAPCIMQVATVETEGLNFVRNYLCNDGTYCGDNYGTDASGIKAHESEADRDLQLIKFVREGQTTAGGAEAKDIILANFQTHPHSGASANFYSAHADAPGIFRDVLSNELDAHVMYISGAGGNINQTSRIAEENIYNDYKQRGKALADFEAWADYKTVKTGKVQATYKAITCDNDHTMDGMLDVAKQIRDKWYATNASSTAMALDTTGGKIHSVYHAEAIVAKAAAEATRDVMVTAISFGDVGICGGQYEMFDTNGMEIKEGSPMEMTFICNMTNGSIGYVPSQLGYTNGGYSTDITRLAPGSGEKLRDEYIAIFQEHRDAQ